MQNWNMFQMAKNHSGVNQSIASFYKTNISLHLLLQRVDYILYHDRD